jgi:hypothetical protein
MERGMENTNSLVDPESMNKCLKEDEAADINIEELEKEFLENLDYDLEFPEIKDDKRELN